MAKYKARGKSSARNSNGAKGIIIAFVVFVLVAAITIAAAVGSKGFTQKHPKNWFNNWGQAASSPSKPDDGNTDNTGTTNSTVVGEGGAIITGYSSNGGATFRSARILKTEYEDYGVKPYADGAYSINVVNQTESAIDFYTWESSNPEKVSISSVSEDTKTATVVCNGEFDKTITITATSTHNSAINASCLVDYAKRINNISCSFSIEYTHDEYDDEGLPFEVSDGTESYNLRSGSTARVALISPGYNSNGDIKNLSITTTGGIGTIEDYDSSRTPTVRLSVIDSLKSEIQSKLGVTCEPVVVDLSSGIEMSYTIMDLFKGASRTQVFQMLESYSNSNIAALQFEFSFVGKYTGNTYTVCCPVAFGCSSFFEQYNITLNPDHIIY